MTDQAMEPRAKLMQQELFQQDGFIIAERLINDSEIESLKQVFDELFSGQFETGVWPDEVNWQQGTGDPQLTRQICNGWKANRTLAAIVLRESFATTIASLAGWPGVRIMIDNVIWKPPGARSLGYHQDSAFLSWFTPSDLVSCWIALDDTSKAGGTVEFVRGSHKWPLLEPSGEFHGPDNYQAPMRAAAAQHGTEPDIAYVEVAAGGGSFHHGRTWHGSGQNQGSMPRRSLVLHAMRANVEYAPAHLSSGTGPVYSRYKRLADNQLDENYFPIVWREDGYRTPAIRQYLAAADRHRG